MVSSKNVLLTCRGALPLALALLQLLARQPEVAGRAPSRNPQNGAPRQPLGSQASSRRSPRCSAAASTEKYLLLGALGTCFALQAKALAMHD